jgi:hypothetical protein
MATESVTAEQPEHPVYQMTTYELSNYKRDLERQIEGLPESARADLRERLAAVLAEQDERRRIRRANSR